MALTLHQCEELIYNVILDGDSKEHFTPEYQAKVLEVIKSIRAEAEVTYKCDLCGSYEIVEG